MWGRRRNWRDYSRPLRSLLTGSFALLRSAIKHLTNHQTHGPAQCSALGALVTIAANDTANGSAQYCGGSAVYRGVARTGRRRSSPKNRRGHPARWPE